MTVHTVRGFVPEVGEEEMEAALARCLAARGYRVRERLRLPADRLPSGPETEVLAWFRTASGDGAVVFDHILPGWERWDLPLVRALSDATGGFAAVIESARTRDQYGAALFWSGRTIELTGLDFEHPEVRLGAPAPFPPGGAEEAVLAAFEEWFSAVTGGHPDDLRPNGGAEVHAWIVERQKPAGDPYSLDAAAEPLLSRAAFALVEEVEFREALRGLGGAAEGWSWTARQTPDVGAPYILLDRDGPLDEGLVASLAAACDVSAAAVELASPGEPFSWIEADPGGRVRSGRGLGAGDFLRLWETFSVTLAASPGSLRRPRRDGM